MNGDRWVGQNRIEKDIYIMAVVNAQFSNIKSGIRRQGNEFFPLIDDYNEELIVQYWLGYGKREYLF